MFRLRSFILITALFSCEVAVAQDAGSASRALPGCRDYLIDAGGDSVSRAYNTGVCGGIMRTMFYFGSSRLGACIPEKATVGQAARVVVQYIDGLPARMHEPFEKLALEALQKTWPCKR